MANDRRAFLLDDVEYVLWPVGEKLILIVLVVFVGAALLGLV